VKKIIPFLLLLVLLPTALAETSFCINETHRQINKQISINISGTMYNVESSEVEYCPYGCVADTGLCRQPSYTQVAIIIALFIVGGIVYLVIRAR
jgi:hypothetical protein